MSEKELKNALKVLVCEYLLNVNRTHNGDFIPPTAIDWLGNGIVAAVADSKDIQELLDENQFLKDKIDELLGMLEDCLLAGEEAKK